MNNATTLKSDPVAQTGTWIVRGSIFFLPSLSLGVILLGGCQKPRPLPEAGTYAQQLYVERCGSCHRPYSPGSMTPAMWEVQMEAMRVKIAQAGLPALSPEQNLTILSYLKRNAGWQ
jgi:hypothetical protein